MPKCGLRFARLCSFRWRIRARRSSRSVLFGVHDYVLEGGVVLGDIAVAEEEAVVVVCVVGDEEVEVFGGVRVRILVGGMLEGCRCRFLTRTAVRLTRLRVLGLCTSVG